MAIHGLSAIPFEWGGRETGVTVTNLKMTQANAGAALGPQPGETFSPEGNPRAFRDALGRFATGVTLVTCMSEAGPIGFAANSFAAVSLDPPLVLWSPAKASARFRYFNAAEHYSIHVLSQDAMPLLNRFSRGGDGFIGLDFAQSPDGVPVIADALARFDCLRHAAHDGGDHVIMVGRVLRALANDGAPLVFSQGEYGQFNAG